MKFFEVILPTLNSPIKNIFTYQSELEINLGDLVEIKLKNKIYYGIPILEVTKPEYKTQEILNIIEPKILNEDQLNLFNYINEYYFANTVKTINLFLPKKIFKSKKDPKIILGQLMEIIDSPRKFTFDFELNDSQIQVLKDIIGNPKKIHLIHGITGSGKTEIYLRLAAEQLGNQKQTLILIPEISLTPQNTKYFQSFFGKEFVEVYHSRLNVTEQFKIWQKVKSGQPCVVIGSRSSLFLPFQNSELIIMDEEHDFAYKQDQNPRYHTRTIVQWHNAFYKKTVVLGSATPSVETYNAAINKKIEYHQINHRSTHIPLPYIQIVDLKDELKKQNPNQISDDLFKAINQTIHNKEQVLLLHNKRGYAHNLTCTDCGHTIECPRCSISLTYHKTYTEQFLQCHYCDLKTATKTSCSNCGGINLKEIGSGIQKIYEELCALFPTAKVIRIDSDTTSTKSAHDDLHEIIHNNEADIILGTQMISIGLNFPNIQLVGVTNADIALSMPDFRAAERSFQLLTQVSGRAGRTNQQGQVIIQTFNTNHPVIQAVKHQNTAEFYAQEIAERQDFNYPPFSKLTKLTYSNPSQHKVETEVTRIETKLNELKCPFKSAPALIEKKHNKFYHHILIQHLKPENIIPYLGLTGDWWIDRDPVSTL